MRSIIKLGRIGSFFFAAACGGAPEDAAPAVPAQGGEVLDDVILGAGKIDTTKKADAEPVLVRKEADADITDGNASFSCTQARDSLTKVPETTARRASGRMRSAPAAPTTATARAAMRS
jgi:hypothetical protein